MARNRDPFTLALASVRERIQSGALGGGHPVIVQEEANRLKLSTTPVREALARLSGEGLVERAAHGGYVASRLDATAARDLYTMHAHYVRIALDVNARALGALRPPAPGFDAADPVDSLSRLFSRIVCSAGNQVLLDAYGRVSGRIDRLRRLEPFLFDDLSDEAARLYAAYSDGSDTGLEGPVSRFHERRIAAAGALAALALGGAVDPASPAG